MADTHRCTDCGRTVEEHPEWGHWPPRCCPGCDCEAHAELVRMVDRVLADPPVFVNGVHVGSTSSLLGEGV